MTTGLPLPKKPPMTVVFVGHVDHGKSTLVGRLLADTGSLPQGKLEQVREACERNSRPFEYAFLIDALKDERAQNITIDAARVFFKSPTRDYVIIDAPGHIEFVKNMVTGASHAEAALLVIDAQEGVRENSRRHGYLLGLLGIKKILVLVNKMDLVDYRQETFEAIRQEYAAFLAQTGVEAVDYLPVSGRAGDNLVGPSAHMPWYTGSTLLAALEAFEGEPPAAHKPFRMPVQDIYKFTRYGDSRRIIAGSVSSGRLHLGDEVIFYPSGKRSVVKSIEAFNRPLQSEVLSGQAVGFTLEEQLYIQRGELAVRHDEPPPKVSSRLRVSLLWLGKRPMLAQKDYWLKLGAARVKARLEKIVRIVDAGQDLTARTLEAGDSNRINRHEVAECILTFNKALAFDLAGEFTDTSRFVLVDDYDICGGGIVLDDAGDTQQWMRENVFLRNLKWEKSEIPAELRAEKYNQRASLILITGQKGAGRKQVAKRLETLLFENGKIVYYLAIGSVLYGVNADLKGKAPTTVHQEHMRRLAEIAHILLDAGVILIVTAIELSQADLEIIKTAADDAQLETIWIGENVTTDIAFDAHLPGGDQVESSAAEIKRLLQDHGVIFRPW